MEAGIHELTAGYALDALDADERRAYEAHLAGCERCQRELEAFWKTTEALAVATSGPAPNPALRDRVLADVRAEPPRNVVPLQPRHRLAPVLGAAAALAAVVALAVGLWGTRLSNDLDDTRAELERSQIVAAVLADPAAETVALQAGEGRLVVGADGRAVLVVDGLEPAPPGKTYEVWIVPGGNIGNASPAGLFAGSEGLEIVGVEGSVSAGDLVAVTVEPAGGADAPSSEPIVATAPV